MEFERGRFPIKRGGLSEVGVLESTVVDPERV
jgi:hypothetical protein